MFPPPPAGTKRKFIVLAAFSFTLNRLVSKNCLATPKTWPRQTFCRWIFCPHRHFAPMDVLSPWMFCPPDVMSPDVLSRRMFCPARSFVCRTFSLSGRFVPPDVLSRRTVCPARHFVHGSFVSGRSVSRCFVSGRSVSKCFVWAPFD